MTGAIASTESSASRLLKVAAGGVLSVAQSQGVLANDTDAEGAPLTAILVTDVGHGVLTLHADGSFTYAPSGGFKFGRAFPAS